MNVQKVIRVETFSNAERVALIMFEDESDVVKLIDMFADVFSRVRFMDSRGHLTIFRRACHDDLLDLKHSLASIHPGHPCQEETLTCRM